VTRSPRMEISGATEGGDFLADMVLSLDVYGGIQGIMPCYFARLYALAFGSKKGFQLRFVDEGTCMATEDRGRCCFPRSGPLLYRRFGQKSRGISPRFMARSRG